MVPAPTRLVACNRPRNRAAAAAPASPSSHSWRPVLQIVSQSGCNCIAIYYRAFRFEADGSLAGIEVCDQEGWFEDAVGTFQGDRH